MEMMIEMDYMELIIGIVLGSVFTGCVFSILDGLKKIRVIKTIRDDIL